MDEFQRLLSRYAKELGYNQHELSVHIDSDVEEDRAIAHVSVLYHDKILLSASASAGSAPRAVASALNTLGCELAAQITVWESAGEFLDEI